MKQTVKRLFTCFAAFVVIMGTGFLPTSQVLAEETESKAVIDDIDMPVIEEIELVNNGGEFTTEDTVRINVYAYDTGSGIESAEIAIS